MVSWMLPFFFVDNKEKWAPCALPVCHHGGGDTLLYRPTQGWTVDEAWILLYRSIYSLTVQPRGGRWRHTAYPSLEAE